MGRLRSFLIAFVSVSVITFLGQGCGDPFEASQDNGQSSQSSQGSGNDDDGSGNGNGSGNNGGGTNPPAPQPPTPMPPQPQPPTPQPPTPPPSSKSFSEVFTTYLGGSNSAERIQGVFVDRDGSVLLGGSTDSFNFPVTPGAFQATKGPGTGTVGMDGFITKIGPDGKTVLWSTYFGGNGRESLYTIRTDSQGNVYAIGSTSSSDLPTGPNSYRRTIAGSPVRSTTLIDFFVAKFDRNGGFQWVTYMGGTQGGEENPRGSILIDEVRQRIYVSGITHSSDFPTTPNAAQPNAGGGMDGVVFALSMDGSRLIASSYFGGAGGDFAFGGIQQDSQGNIYISGATASTTIPARSGNINTGIRSGANARSAFSGDGYVAKFNPDLTQILWVTTVGGSAGDSGSHNQGFAMAANDEPVILVNALSANYPTTSGAYSRQFGGQTDCAITRLTSNGQIKASTFVGSSALEECNGIHVDNKDRIMFTGSTTINSNFPMTNDALNRNTIGGRMDGIFVVLSPNLDQLIYSTRIGGSDDGMNGGGNDDPGRTWLAPDKGRSIWSFGDRVYVGGVSDASDMNTSTTPGVIQPNNRGANDGILYRFDWK